MSSLKIDENFNREYFQVN